MALLQDVLASYNLREDLPISARLKPPYWRMFCAAVISRSDGTEPIHPVILKAQKDPVVKFLLSYLEKEGKALEAAKSLSKTPVQKRDLTRRINLIEAHADLHDAMIIYSELRDSLLKYQIEAMLVANADPIYISNYTGVDVECIETYEKLFFDVRSRLALPGFVQNSLLRDGLLHGFPADNPNITWKAVAFACGDVQALEAYWSYSTPLAQKVREIFHNMTSAILTRNCLKAQMAQIVHAGTIESINVHANEVRKIELAERQAAQGGGGAEDELGGLMNMIKAAVPMSGVAVGQDGKPLQQVICRREPRASELLIAASRVEIEAIDDVDG